jgi:hypothetical protein
MNYTPPTPEDLERLKGDLQYSSTDMADLFGVATGRQWRRYTSTNTEAGVHRDMSAHMLFFGMARLELDAKTIERVLARMRKAGASIDLSGDAGESES